MIQVAEGLEFEDLGPNSKAFTIVIDHIGSVLPDIFTSSVLKMWASSLGEAQAEYYFCDGSTSLCTTINDTFAEVIYPMEDDRATSQDDFVEIKWHPTHIECSVKYQQVAANTLCFKVPLEDLVACVYQFCSVIDETTFEA